MFLEKLKNLGFKLVEFDQFKNEAGDREKIAVVKKGAD